jgi:hypothetical protein
MTTTARRTRGDDGVALLLVLAFVLVMSVIVGALLRQSYTTLRVARTTTDVGNRVHAANAGADWALQRLRQQTLVGGAVPCADPAGVQTLATDLALVAAPAAAHRPNPTVTVTCTVQSGSSVGAGGWSLFLTDQAGGVRTMPSAVATKTVVGPVYNAGAFTFDTGTTLAVQDGDVRVRPGATCPAGFAPAASPPFTCATAAAAPLAPLAPVNLAPERNPVGFGPLQDVDGDHAPSGCRVFQPGRYEDQMQFLPPAAGVNYLRSGIYYLDDLPLAGDAGPQVIDAVVVGGIPAAGELPETPAVQAAAAAGCPIQSAADTSGHYGVVFVLGGDSTIEVRSGAQVELFPYVDPSTGGAGVSLYQLGASEWGSSEQSRVTGPNAVLVGSRAGSDAKMAFHGLAYVPYARIAARGTNQASASFTGGVVAAALDLEAGPGAGGLSVSNRSGPGKRTIRIEAATDRIGSERDLRATVEVSVANDASRTLTITSWKVNQ